MGNYERKIISYFTIFLFVTLLGCRTNSTSLIVTEIVQSSHNKNISSLVDEMNKIEIDKCKFDWKLENQRTVVQVIHANINDLFCIRNEARKGNQKAIESLIVLIEYWEKDDPSEFLKLYLFERVYDSNLFEALIEILQYQTEYDCSSDYIKMPVHMRVGYKLIEPMIDTIDGLPKSDYMKNRDYKQSYDCTAQEYYTQIKKLWQEGKIKLKGQLKN